MRQFLSLRYLMTSNVPFEKNKMASTLAASVIIHGLFTKCKEVDRPVKFKGKRKRRGEETEKSVTSFPLGNYQRESCSANLIQNHRMSSQVNVYTSKRIFCPTL